MAKHKIREDKTCLNCGAYVEEEYCPKCGQRNAESRESFAALFGEFISDFVHYDSSFWKTTKYLLFRPGRLSLEYMNGKRKSYVHPVKLYIFISFIAFFIPAILPQSDNKKEDLSLVVENTPNEFVTIDTTYLDSDHIKITTKTTGKGEREKIKTKIKTISEPKYLDSIPNYGIIYSVKQFDSIHNSLPKGERMHYGKYRVTLLELQGMEDSSVNDRKAEFMKHNFPKAIFLYMPIFAFLLFLFHYRRFYFDSGIFTLHLFSFILLVSSLYNIGSYVLGDICNLPEASNSLLTLVLFWVTYYFMRGHYKFYGGKKKWSIVKSVSIIIINFFAILAFLVLYTFSSIVWA